MFSLTIQQGDLLASPILETLCKSFYEEEKWQRSLMVDAEADGEWICSVPDTMVALAATAVSTLSFVRKFTFSDVGV